MNVFCPLARARALSLPPPPLTPSLCVLFSFAGNEALLMAQNPELAREYLLGVWAHETGEPEVC